MFGLCSKRLQATVGLSSRWLQAGSAVNPFAGLCAGVMGGWMLRALQARELVWKFAGILWPAVGTPTGSQACVLLVLATLTQCLQLLRRNLWEVV